MIVGDKFLRIRLFGRPYFNSRFLGDHTTENIDLFEGIAVSIRGPFQTTLAVDVLLDLHPCGVSFRSSVPHGVIGVPSHAA